ncbi:oxygen-independent coproporphyrinogen III oxidase [Flaviaesturariibacter aridisoli]|uniref:Coproporphyrinogen-III oxidase n=1 Tax=Flaviaesturariibacter aridisoli TaxID=2545761 RepID=A0A4R4DXQ2_9BACT|nr:oxygen-independent coproporphyrinogen III oxidase [Flaviaesturariibacter aridisoli]TCZ65692.1 oxygen-independent coproporphyrinogen III oxidase [Flaviaesturariibacter aridisoli]
MNREAVSPLLIRKYNQPVPRYTSYPTVPYWQEGIDAEAWKETFRRQFHEENHTRGISLYLHLPFCESLCTYCGCNKKITTNHSVEEPYLRAVLEEWKSYRKLMQQTPVIRELHLGGGTPTFFSPRHLKLLLQELLKGAIVHPQHQFSIEGHPNNTTDAHLKVLYELGFHRISYGVQDLDPEVQRVINRIQPFENVQRATGEARAAGFTSINFDLIYGLPLQTAAGMEQTIRSVITLKPERIAFYSYAHVPWNSKAQRLFNESHLPSPEQKLELYRLGKDLLLEAGYEDIGMDHFALPSDELSKARADGRLHRNFMGYTTQDTGLLLGLGVSSISDAGTAFAQNAKTLHDYYAMIGRGELAVTKGYFLTEEDRAFRRYILDASCRGQVSFRSEDRACLDSFSKPVLEKLAEDGLVTLSGEGMTITETGRHFVRNICAAFDLLKLRSEAAGDEGRRFSQAI